MRRRWIARLLLVAVTGCNPFGPADFSGLSLDLRTSPHVARPGTEVEVTAIAYLPANQTLSQFRVRLSAFGAVDSTDLPIVGPGPHGYTIRMRIARVPIEGQVAVDLIARLGSDYDSVRRAFTVADDGPPQVTIDVVPAVEPPDSLYVQYLAIDSAAVDSLVLRVRGAATYDAVVQGDTVVAVGGLLRLWIPPEIALGDSVTIDAEVTDLFGKRTTARRVVHVRDITYPDVTLAVDPVLHTQLDPQPRYAFFPGDTMRLRIVATDTRGIARLGYQWLQRGDSVVTTGSTDSAAFEYVVPAGINVEGEPLVAFAVDSAGNRGGQQIYATVIDGSFRPVTSINYPNATIASDVHGAAVLDARRDRLYFTTRGERIEVVALNPLAPLAGIEVGVTVPSIDLSPGGDSLIVLLTQPNRLVIWSLSGTVSQVGTVMINAMPLRCDAWDMRMAANGRALITGQAGCPTVDVHLRTGAQRLRRPDNVVISLDGSADHRSIMQWDALSGSIYHSDTDSLEPFKALFPGQSVSPVNIGPAFDQSGRRILIRNRLYDSTLSAYRWLQPDPGQLPPARALSADGNTAFLGLFPGYWRIDVATGTVQERVALPLGGGRLIAHPDGERLIVIGWGRISIVDLR